MTMMPYGWLPSPQVTMHADFRHPTSPTHDWQQPWHAIGNGQPGADVLAVIPLPVVTLTCANATACCMAAGTTTLAHHGSYLRA